MTILCVIICALHLVGVVVMSIAEDEGSLIRYRLGKSLFYGMSVLAIGIMLYYIFNHLAIKPIVALATYMVIPGFVTLLGNLFAFDRAENKLVSGTIITVITTIVAIVTFVMLG